MITELKNNGKNVALFSPIQIPGEDLSSKLPRLIKFGRINKVDIESFFKVEIDVYNSNFFRINNIFQNELSDNYIKVYLDLCNEAYCYYAKNNSMYFADHNHLSQNILDELIFTIEQLAKVINK